MISDINVHVSVIDTIYIYIYIEFILCDIVYRLKSVLSRIMIKFMK